MQSTHRENAPMVSVCIPVYKGTSHLAITIESVLAQSFEDFELLIIDDHSPEDMEAIVGSYRDPRIRFLRNPENLGAEGNWNRCLAESRGRYIKLLPMDDLLAPDCLEKQVAVLEQDTEQCIALVFCARSIIDAKGRVIMRRSYPQGKQGPLSGTKLIRRCVRFGTNLIGEPGAVLFRRSLAEKTGLFSADVPYVIDLDYWFRLLRHGDAYYLIETLASFRVWRHSWSVRIGTGQGSDFYRFITKIRENRPVQLNHFDIIAGHVMARVNGFLRMLIYGTTIKGA
jgi:glycosyltransferase involved in cell wall biosynthesis